MTRRTDRVELHVRITADGMAALDRIAARDGVDRSTVVRRMLADGVARDAHRTPQDRR